MTPPKLTCTRCGKPCDFGQRGDGPAVQNPKTMLVYCSQPCHQRSIRVRVLASLHLLP